MRRLRMICSPDECEPEGTAARSNSRSDIMSEIGKLDAPEPIGPRSVSAYVAHKTRIRQNQKVDASHQPAWPEAKVAKEIAIDNEFRIH